MDNKENVSKRVWKEVIDPSSRSVYYWNISTGDTSWVNPSNDESQNDFNSFEERVSHDTKVIIDKLVHKVERIKFFFDEINLISDVCDYIKSEDINSFKDNIEQCLSDLNTILDVVTPRTKTHKRYSELRKVLTDHRNFLKNNNNISDELIDIVNEARDEIDRGLENIKMFPASNDVLLDDFKVYMEKRKLDAKTDMSLTSVEVLEQIENLEHSTKHKSTHSHQSDSMLPKTVDKNKGSLLKSIHERWSKASEVIDNSDDSKDSKIQKVFKFPNTEKDNPNLVPITKPWYKN
uniref:WW domain containing protein, putative n=1 Tax=Theileria annulata TaxID=5874 RepID=A0A3B0MR06_THEAN